MPPPNRARIAPLHAESCEAGQTRRLRPRRKACSSADSPRLLSGNLPEFPIPIRPHRSYSERTTRHPDLHTGPPSPKAPPGTSLIARGLHLRTPPYTTPDLREDSARSGTAISASALRRLRSGSPAHWVV